MSLTMDSKQLVHMLNISNAALGCTMCSHVYISLCIVLYVATYATNITAVFHPTVYNTYVWMGQQQKLTWALWKAQQVLIFKWLAFKKQCRLGQHTSTLGVLLSALWLWMRLLNPQCIEWQLRCAAGWLCCFFSCCHSPSSLSRRSSSSPELL